MALKPSCAVCETIPGWEKLRTSCLYEDVYCSPRPKDLGKRFAILLRDSQIHVPGCSLCQRHHPQASHSVQRSGAHLRPMPSLGCSCHRKGSCHRFVSTPFGPRKHRKGATEPLRLLILAIPSTGIDPTKNHGSAKNP